MADSINWGVLFVCVLTVRGLFFDFIFRPLILETPIQELMANRKEDQGCFLHSHVLEW